MTVSHGVCAFGFMTFCHETCKIKGLPKIEESSAYGNHPEHYGIHIILKSDKYQGCLNCQYSAYKFSLRERSLFMGGGGGVGENFATYSRGGGGGGGSNFFLAYFLKVVIFFNALFLRFFFHKSYITCILIVVGALQQHKGMFLKHGRGGAKFFLQCHGGGGIFFPCILKGDAVAIFFLPIDFAKSPPPPPQP